MGAVPEALVARASAAGVGLAPAVLALAVGVEQEPGVAAQVAAASAVVPVLNVAVEARAAGEPARDVAPAEAAGELAAAPA